MVVVEVGLDAVLEAQLPRRGGDAARGQGQGTEDRPYEWLASVSTFIVESSMLPTSITQTL